MSYAPFIPQREPGEAAEDWIDRAIYPLSQLANQRSGSGASVSGGRVYVSPGPGAQGLLDIGIITGGNIVQVDSAAIVDAAVTTAKLADLGVSDAKIADAAILTAKIADAAIVSAKIGDLQVTDAKINTVAANKLTAGVIATNQIYVGGTSFEIQGGDKRIVIKDEQASPVTRVELGKFSNTANDHGIKIRDASGNLIMEAGAQAKLYGSNITTEALVVTDEGDGIAIKLNGSGTQARIRFDQNQFINGGTDDQLGINAGFSPGKSIICDSGAEFVINNDAGVRVSTRSNIESPDNNTLNQTFSTSGSYTGNMVAAIMNRAATTSVNFFTGTSNNSGSADVEFLVRGDGIVASDGGSTMSSPADYAEYFETLDGQEIAPGVSVVLESGKVRPAVAGEDPIGVVRPAETSCVIGNAAWNHWARKWLRDEYDSPVLEPYSVYKWLETRPRESAPEVNKVCEVTYPVDGVPDGVTVPDDAEIVTVDESGAPLMRRVLNPDFDDSLAYTPREQRAEWVVVGLLGQIPVNAGQPTGARWLHMEDRTSEVALWFVR